MTAATSTDERRGRRRAAHHQARVDRAATPKQGLWIACGWLVKEAWKAGCLGEATRGVLAMANRIRRGDAP